MTVPANGTQSTTSSRAAPPAPPPPSPKIQAITFALQLADIRTKSSVGAEKVTDVAQLISDAQAIAGFIGADTPNPVAATFARFRGQP